MLLHTQLRRSRLPDISELQRISDERDFTLLEMVQRGYAQKTCLYTDT